MNVFYFEWEYNLLMWFQSIRNTFLDFIMPKISFLGNSGWFWIVTALALLIFTKKDKRIGWQACLSLVVSVVVCNIILKHAVDRARPCDIWTEVETIVSRPSDASFPSGHTNASFAVATAIFTRNKKWGIAALIIALLIGISRMYLFMHFPTDVLCGALNGVIWGILSYYFVNWFFKKTGKPVDTLKIF